MLDNHFTSTVTISRKVVTGNKTTFSALPDQISCHIQPLSPVYQNGEWGRLHKEYRMFSTEEVRIGDKLVDQDGTAYEVFGVVSYRFRIGRRHYEANLRGI
jgi:hypothetical protein